MYLELTVVCILQTTATTNAICSQLEKKMFFIESLHYKNTVSLPQFWPHSVVRSYHVISPLLPHSSKIITVCF